MDKRKLLLHAVLLLLLSLQEYSANARLVLLHLTSSLNLPMKFFHEEEVRVARGLGQVAFQHVPEVPTDQKGEEAKVSRKLKMGLAGLIHPSGTPRLAGPLRAVGIGTPHDGHGLTPISAASLLGAMSENGAIIGSFFGIYTAKPTSKMLESFQREIQDFALVPVHGNPADEYVDAKIHPSERRRLRFVIAMSGWLSDRDQVTRPWRYLGDQAESYVVKWEMNTLVNLGTALETVIKSTAWGAAKDEIDARTSTYDNVNVLESKLTIGTVFKCLMEATWPCGLLKISKVIDNSWSIGMVRAEKAGAVLADAIMRSKMQGDRPVSLVGFSLGARSIYTCLMILAERRQFGIVESVVMMGTPAPSESRVWLTLKSVVSGRLINVYSESDYLLGFLYRTSNIQFGVAGLQEIQGADGVENHDVGDLVRGHLRYSSVTGKILKDIGWEDLDMEVYKAEKQQTKRGGRK